MENKLKKLFSTSYQGKRPTWTDFEWSSKM